MKNKRIISIFVFLLIITPIVYSFGLTTPFFGDIEMYKNDKRVITFMMQNMVGEQDLDVKAELLAGNEIARVIEQGKIIKVPYGRNDVPINVELITPENPKKEYQIAFIVRTLPSPERRTVQLATGLEKRFKVVVSEGTRPGTSSVQIETVPQPVIEEPGLFDKGDRQTVLLAIFLVIVIIILYKWVRKHKEKYDLKRLKDEFSL